MTYTTLTILDTPFIRRDDDGAVIPCDPANRDYQTFLSWITAGNTPGVVAPPTPAPVRSLPTLAFRMRLTTAERGALTLTAAQKLAAGDPTLQVALDDLGASVLVNLNDPKVAAIIDLATSLGILTPDRKAALLADPTPAELAG